MSSEHYEVAIKDKMTLSIEEAAAYSGIGMNKLRELTKSPFCDFVLYVGKKTLIKKSALRRVHKPRYRGVIRLFDFTPIY